MLFRGADKEALNYAGQTAYQVAVIAGNLELSEIIKNHRSEDIGKDFDVKIYNNICTHLGLHKPSPFRTKTFGFQLYILIIIISPTKLKYILFL